MVKSPSFTASRGFTLIEIMIVVAVIGIIAAIAAPNYQRYVVKTKRTAMMTDLQNIGSQIQAQKLAKGSYANVPATTYTGDYPQQGSVKLYTVTGTLDSNNDGIAGDWKITATPKTGTQVVNDGVLTLTTDGIKCRGTACGKGNEWNN